MRARGQCQLGHGGSGYSRKFGNSDNLGPKLSHNLGPKLAHHLGPKLAHNFGPKLAHNLGPKLCLGPHFREVSLCRVAPSGEAQLRGGSVPKLELGNKL